MEVNRLMPFDWWWSGRLWYCSLKMNGKKVSGAGLTKPQAVDDARKELVRRVATSSRTA